MTSAAVWAMVAVLVVVVLVAAVVVVVLVMKQPAASALAPAAAATGPAEAQKPAGELPLPSGTDNPAPPVLANPAGRLVGIMYSTWADSWGYAKDTAGKHIMQTEAMKDAPDAGGPKLYWWGHPSWAGGDIDKYRFVLDGKANAPLIVYHANLLVAAGVDFIAIDITNGNATALKGLKALCETYARLKHRPRVVPWARTTEDVEQLKRELFDKFPADLWLQHEGKPLLLVGDQFKTAIPTGGVFDNFTARKMWGLTREDVWTFKQNLRTGDRYEPFMRNGKPEQMSVAVATQSTYMSDASTLRQGREGGAYMARQFEIVNRFRPKFVVVTSWNEWFAIRGKGDNGYHFVDQFGPEYSADVEPSQELGTKYYDLLCGHIKTFKALP